VLEIATMPLGVCLRQEDKYFYFSDINPNFAWDPYLLSKKKILQNFLTEKCPSLEIYDKSKILIISDKDFSSLVTNSTKYIEEYCSTFNKSEGEVITSVAEFMDKKRILIQPTGISGLFNKATNKLQTGWSAIHAFNTISSSQITGMTGGHLITSSQMLIITLPTVGGIFFTGLERVFNNTVFGNPCGITGRVLLIPMKGIEIFVNGFILDQFNQKLGLDLAINMTDTIVGGAGFEASKYVKFNKFVENKVHHITEYLLKLLKKPK
jgi:hypothetical protein